jgi:hypothetical protein
MRRGEADSFDARDANHACSDAKCALQHLQWRSLIGALRKVTSIVVKEIETVVGCQSIDK